MVKLFTFFCGLIAVTLAHGSCHQHGNGHKRGRGHKNRSGKSNRVKGKYN